MAPVVGPYYLKNCRNLDVNPPWQYTKLRSVAEPTLGFFPSAYIKIYKDEYLFLTLHSSTCQIVFKIGYF